MSSLILKHSYSKADAFPAEELELSEIDKSDVKRVGTTNSVFIIFKSYPMITNAKWFLCINKNI